MTGQAYWGAIAQIVPVLALALVLEVRVIGRRMARKAAYKYNRGLRVTYAVTYLVVAGGLALIQGVALRYLFSEKSGEHLEPYVTFFVSLAFSYVVIGPIGLIGAALMGDTLELLPWSRESRARRAANAIAIDVIDAERDARNVRLEAWGELADLQVQLARLTAAADRATGPGARLLRLEADDTQARMARLRDRLIESRNQTNARVSEHQSSIERLRETLADAERARRLLTELSKQ